MILNEDKIIIEIDTIIIGGGISAIFVGLEFINKGFNDFVILEKEDRPGGLCRSFQFGELYYDLGAHALHKQAILSSDKLRETINPNKLYCQKRKAKVFIFDKLIPHPFQLHIFYAPMNIKLKCFYGYLVKKNIMPGNLKEWLLSKFGKQVCEYFLFPYNEKAWRTDLSNISLNWINRVSAGNSKFIKGLFFKGDKNYSSNEFVCYPSNGGFENLFSDGIKKLSSFIKINEEVIGVDLENKLVQVKNGVVYHYDKLISTVPIDILVTRLIETKDNEIIKLVSGLEKVSTCIVTFLTTKQSTDLQRVYVPEKKYLSQRITINSNSSGFFKEKSESLFSLEISYKKRNDLPAEDIIIDDCKKLLKDVGLVKSNNDIKNFKIEFFEYMYPTQTVRLDNIILQTKSYLQKYDCYTIGRFGSWNYANIDGILDEGIELIDKYF
ncbi:MAG: FAD-dependent oxidoreductase [Patescibacteria group bacterium]